MRVLKWPADQNLELASSSKGDKTGKVMNHKGGYKFGPKEKGHTMI